MDSNPDNKPLILASASPRRRDLLSGVGVPIETRAAQVDESPDPGEEARDYALRMARSKAQAIARQAPGRWVLGADTVVVADGEKLGKPRDHQDGRDMLLRLSGRSHQVLTGVMLLGPAGQEESFSSTTQVSFRTLSERLVEGYLKTGEPFDKAGAYGIQGQGALLVESIQGSYTNVVGLPLCETVALLEEAGIFQAFSVGGSQAPQGAGDVT